VTISTRLILHPPSVEGLSPAQTIRLAEEYLSHYDVASPRRTAELLLMHVLRTHRAGLYSRREPLAAEEATQLARALSEGARGVPVHYIAGRQDFMELVLQVSPGVFIPRPETERLAEAALDVLSDCRSEPVVIDVGTGTGAIALAIKHHVPRARVIASDVSADAVQVARANANRLNLDVEVLEGDFLDPVANELRGNVDLLVSNPPYVTVEEYDSLPTEVKAEPQEALLGGIEFHRRLVDAATKWLAPGGWLLTEIGADQGREVSRIFSDRLTDVDVLPDLAGRDRVVRGSLKNLA